MWGEAVDRSVCGRLPSEKGRESRLDSFIFLFAAGGKSTQRCVTFLLENGRCHTPVEARRNRGGFNIRTYRSPPEC